MNKLGLAGVLSLLAAPTAALAQNTPVDTHGHLSVKEALHFQRTVFPKVAPAALLRDSRAYFFHARKPLLSYPYKPNSYTVRTHFLIKLVPDRAHRRKHWYPIRCHGVNIAQRTKGGGIKGDIGHYKCVTILP
jgi:hypothetical protein